MKSNPNTTITLAILIFGMTVSSLRAGDIQANNASFDTLQVTNGASSGKFLKSDASGNATWSTPPAIIGSFQNLAVATYGANWTNTVVVTADELVLKNSSGVPYLASNVSESITNTATSGNPGGRDTGNEAGTNWYYVWIVSDGSSVDGIFSSSSTSPTLTGNLSSYTYKALVGAVFNDSVSNFVSTFQYDRSVWLPHSALFTSKAIATAGTYEQPSASELETFRNAVPPIAKTFSGYVARTDNSATLADVNFCISPVTGSPGQSQIGFKATTNWFYSPFSIPLKTTGASRTFYITAGTVTLVKWGVWVNGYTF